MTINDPAQAIVAPNVMARSQVLECKAAKTKEWEAAQARWREAAGQAFWG